MAIGVRSSPVWIIEHYNRVGGMRCSESHFDTVKQVSLSRSSMLTVMPSLLLSGILPMSTLFCFLFTVGLLNADEKPKEEARSDQDKIQGTWVCESVSSNGEFLPAEARKAIQFTFKGDKVTVHIGDKDTKRESTFKLDPSKKPREITMRMKDSEKELKGIYAFDGESLKICAGALGDERPTGFVAKKGNNLLLVELKRAKP
jgi:uncharacterized protein (TIGR03067 family)